MDTRTDSDLITACAEAGDENAFAELVARHQRMVWLGDCYSKEQEPAAAKQVWEKLNSEFPESNWGKYARGRLFPEGA